MRIRLLITVCMSVLCFFSCKEKTEYGTSIVFENQLNDSINIKLYPRYEPYSLLTEYSLAKNEYHAVYGKSGQSEVATFIMHDIFDSVIIRSGDKIVKFTNDTVIGYRINIFKDNNCWTKKTITYDTPTNFSSNPHEDIGYFFTLTMDNLE